MGGLSGGGSRTGGSVGAGSIGGDFGTGGLLGGGSCMGGFSGWLVWGWSMQVRITIRFKDIFSKNSPYHYSLFPVWWEC
jgi:hypothetical protein